MWIERRHVSRNIDGLVQECVMISISWVSNWMYTFHMHGIPWIYGCETYFLSANWSELTRTFISIWYLSLWIMQGIRIFAVFLSTSYASAHTRRSEYRYTLIKLQSFSVTVKSDHNWSYDVFMDFTSSFLNNYWMHLLHKTWLRNDSTLKQT